MLVAMEEETKKRAQVHKKRYAGPMVRWKSRKVGEEEMVSVRESDGGLLVALRSGRLLPHSKLFTI